VANRKGLSPVLIVVALAIIGLLFLVVFWFKNNGTSDLLRLTKTADVSNIEKISNDGDRKTDFIDLQSTLKLAILEEEIILVDTKSCQDCTSDTGSRDLDGSGWVKFTVPPGKKGITIWYPEKKLQVDPVNSGEYIYSYYSDGSKFELNATLSSDRATTDMKDDNGNDDTKYEVGTSLFLH